MLKKTGGYAIATLSDMLALFGDERKWQQPPILFSWWFSTRCFLVDVSSSTTLGSEFTTPLHELIRVRCKHDCAWFAACPKPRHRTRHSRFNTSSSTQTKPCLYWRELGREICCSNIFPTVLRQIKFLAIANEKDYQKTLELGHWPLRWVDGFKMYWNPMLTSTQNFVPYFGLWMGLCVCFTMPTGFWLIPNGFKWKLWAIYSSGCSCSWLQKQLIHSVSYLGSDRSFIWCNTSCSVGGKLTVPNTVHGWMKIFFARSLARWNSPLVWRRKRGHSSVGSWPSRKVYAKAWRTRLVISAQRWKKRWWETVSVFHKPFFWTVKGTTY